MDYARYSIAANPNDLIRDVIQKVQDACNEAGDKVSVKSLFCAASLDPAATVKACGLTARDVVIINGADGATDINYDEDSDDEEGTSPARRR